MVDHIAAVNLHQNQTAIGVDMGGCLHGLGRFSGQNQKTLWVKNKCRITAE